MEFQPIVSWISSPVQIAFLDLVLGADNAVIIALVCRSLPRHQRLNVMIVGTGAAMLLRIVLTALTGALMFAPLLRLVGGFVLILIAISLTDQFDVGPVAGKAAADDGRPRDHQAESEAFWDAILLVVLADGVMSLDNTVALAAVAQGDVVYLVLGLALSVPTLVFGSWLLSELLGQTPFLASFAMAVLAWVAGDMAVSDPLIADWIKTTAPALTLGIPIACVVFVLAKAAFKPVALTILPVGPLDSFGLGADAAEGATSADPNSPSQTPDIQTPDVQTPWPAEPAPDAEPAAADAPAPEVVVPVTELEDAELEDAEPNAEGGRQRTGEERLLIAGFVVLFAIAAVIMSAAIYLGGATF